MKLCFKLENANRLLLDLACLETSWTKRRSPWSAHLLFQLWSSRLWGYWPLRTAPVAFPGISDCAVAQEWKSCFSNAMSQTIEASSIDYYDCCLCYFLSVDLCFSDDAGLQPPCLNWYEKFDLCSGLEMGRSCCQIYSCSLGLLTDDGRYWHRVVGMDLQDSEAGTLLLMVNSELAGSCHFHTSLFVRCIYPCWTDTFEGLSCPEGTFLAADCGWRPGHQLATGHHAGLFEMQAPFSDCLLAPSCRQLTCTVVLPVLGVSLADLWSLTTFWLAATVVWFSGSRSFLSGCKRPSSQASSSPWGPRLERAWWGPEVASLETDCVELGFELDFHRLSSWEVALPSQLLCLSRQRLSSSGSSTAIFSKSCQQWGQL